MTPLYILCIAGERFLAYYKDTVTGLPSPQIVSCQEWITWAQQTFVGVPLLQIQAIAEKHSVVMTQQQSNELMESLHSPQTQEIIQTMISVQNAAVLHLMQILGQQQEATGAAAGATAVADSSGVAAGRARGSTKSTTTAGRSRRSKVSSSTAAGTKRKKTNEDAVPEGTAQVCSGKKGRVAKSAPSGEAAQVSSHRPPLHNIQVATVRCQPRGINRGRQQQVDGQVADTEQQQQQQQQPAAHAFSGAPTAGVAGLGATMTAEGPAAASGGSTSNAAAAAEDIRPAKIPKGTCLGCGHQRQRSNEVTDRCLFCCCCNVHLV